VTAADVVVGAARGSVVALASGRVLHRGLRRMGHLRLQVLAVTLSSLAVGAVVASVLARQMVLDAEELRVVISVLIVTAGFATILVITATSSLGHDVQRLERTVRAIEAGDRSARVGIRRADELGHVAAALDETVLRLGQLEQARDRDDERRVAMFSNISHDLRTPLAALRAALEAVEDGIPDDPARYVRSMHRDVEALTALVDDLFLLARIEGGNIEIATAHVDLAEIADEAVEALAPVAAAHAVLVQVETGDPAIVAGNPTALGRVIRNLLDNAIRHSPPGSTIEVVVAAGARPSVRVRDRGAGFPAGFRSEAFDRFSRADASRSRTTGGAGLGLAIARGLVDAHGGEIWIDEEPGGASVAFAVPAALPAGV
jgi:two-component system, OmpR family, sensor histidine kinase BaeS